MLQEHAVLDSALRAAAPVRMSLRNRITWTTQMAAGAMGEICVTFPQQKYQVAAWNWVRPISSPGLNFFFICKVWICSGCRQKTLSALVS